MSQMRKQHSKLHCACFSAPLGQAGRRQRGLSVFGIPTFVAVTRWVYSPGERQVASIG
jgi:hypothetical protein